ncbi:S8 family serine peptidase, partial [bacterium]|nr:S8 family serine peptidase [bacterium]
SAPADGDSVLALAAVDSVGNYVSFSPQGPTADFRIKPDVSAMGSFNWVADPNTTNDYGYSGGTSFSCPAAAGAVAILLQAYPDLEPVELIQVLKETASHPDEPDNYTGWGVIDLPTALLSAEAIAEPCEAIPLAFHVSAPRPNPFNGYVQATVRVHRPGPYQVHIYNSLGRLEEVIHRGHWSEGVYNIHWSNAAASGVYYLHVKAPQGDTQTRKLVFIR